MGEIDGAALLELQHTQDAQAALGIKFGAAQKLTCAIQALLSGDSSCGVPPVSSGLRRRRQTVQSTTGDEGCDAKKAGAESPQQKIEGREDDGMEQHRRRIPLHETS